MKLHRILTIAGALLFSASIFAAELPADIKWETNLDEPPIGDPKALKGGTLYTHMESYPLTFRIYGPNSNDAFASWNRQSTQDMALVILHPNTDKFIPWMASHWSVQPDNKTVYYKLRPEAKWSDGEPVTADDYVFTLETWKNPNIVDPYYPNFADNYFQSVEAVDDYTLKVVGKQESWRPLALYNLYATPRHVLEKQLNEWKLEWPEKANNLFQVVQGPYRVTDSVTGERVTLSKVPNWWGTDIDYFEGLYNPETIVVKVIPEERDLDYFVKGEIDYLQENTSKTWATEYNFDAVKNGWVHKKQVFIQTPAGVYGLHMNLEAPIFKNKDFRKAVQYFFNFDEINNNLMYKAYFRQVSAFEGTEYENKDLKPYPFDPKKGKEHLNAAGYTKRDKDGILMNDKGERASFELIYGSKGLEPHLTLVQQTYKKAGIEVKLKNLDPATAFNLGQEKKYEMIVSNRTAGFWPDPNQYFHSKFKNQTDNNNIWGFGTPETDALIETYMFNMDMKARLDAMYKLDQMIQDEAFYLPFWDAPYIRISYWDKLCWPEWVLPRNIQQVTDHLVMWIDPAKEAALKEAIAAKKSLGEDKAMEVDYFKVKPQ